MAKIPIRIVDAGSNTTAGMGHRSLGPLDGLAVVGSEVAAANVTGGVVPMSSAEYIEIFKRYLAYENISPAAWYRADTGVTVTGQGVSTLADQSGNGRDLLQGTDASRPPYLGYSGTKYLYLPGVAGNNATSPDSVAASFTGDCEFVARMMLPDWTPSTTLPVISKRGASNAWQFSIVGTTGVIRLNWWDSGGTLKTADSTSAPTVSDGAKLWIKATLDVDNGAAGNDVIFYTAADQSTEPSSWTKLGNTVTGAGTTSVRDTSDQMLIGQDSGSTVARADIYRLIVRSGIDGTTVVDFNPDRDGSDQAATITSSATGEVWTINKSGGLPAQIVGRPSLLFDGTADYLKCNAFTLNQPETVYIAFKQVSWTSPDTLFDGDASTSMLCQQFTGTPKVRIFATSGLTAADGPAIGAYGVLSAVFNGASSLFATNNGTATTGDIGAGNAGGFTLGANGGSSNPSNIQVLEVLIFSTAHDATQRARVIQYLAGRHGVAL